MSDEAHLLIFPDKIITEILTRLPAKPLCRFKTVSKRWNSIISGPTFTSTYISRNSPSWAILDQVINFRPNPGFTGPAWFRHVEPPLVSHISVTTDFSNKVEEDSAEPYPSVVATSNGFLILGSTLGEEETYFVGNPITREWVRLPETECKSYRGCIGLTTRVDPNSSLVDRFMVVKFIPYLKDDKVCLMCYDSESGEWEEKVDPLGNTMLKDQPWRPVGGSFEFRKRVHWFDFCAGIMVWEADPFRSVGKRKTKCRHIPLPQECLREFYDLRSAGSRCVGVSAGFVQFMEVVENGSECDLKLWRLSDYEAGKWGLVYKESIWVEKKLDVVVLPKPWLFHPFEPDSVYFQVNDNVYFINPKTKRVELCRKFTHSIKPLLFTNIVFPSLPSPLPQLNAASAKEQGDICFKKKKFEEAITHYSRTIFCSPTAAVYSNRAAAYLNLKRCREAESDCTEALKLDKHCLKSCWRRVLARKELGKLKEAMEDADHALEIVPGQPEMLKLHAQIKSLLEKANIIEECIEDMRRIFSEVDP